MKKSGELYVCCCHRRMNAVVHAEQCKYPKCINHEEKHNALTAYLA